MRKEKQERTLWICTGEVLKNICFKLNLSLHLLMFLWKFYFDVTLLFFITDVGGSQQQKKVI